MSGEYNRIGRTAEYLIVNLKTNPILIP